MRHRQPRQHVTGAIIQVPLQFLDQTGDTAVEIADAAAETAQRAVTERLDLADRNVLSAHREGRRVLINVDGRDDALHLRGHGDRLAVGAGRADRHRVSAVGQVWPLLPTPFQL